MAEPTDYATGLTDATGAEASVAEIVADDDPRLGELRGLADPPAEDEPEQPQFGPLAQEFKGEFDSLIDDHVVEREALSFDGFTQSAFAEEQAKAPQTHDDPGLADKLGKAFTRGGIALKQQSNTFRANNLLNALTALDEVDKRAAPLDFAGGMRRAKPKAKDAAGVFAAYEYMTPEQRGKLRARYQKELGAQIRAISARQVAIEGIPQPPEVVEALQAETWGEFWTKFKKAPITFISVVGVESLPASAPSIAAGTAGFLVGGPVGAAAATFGPSFGTDYTSHLISALYSEGVNVRDPEALAAGLANTELMERVGERAKKHAAGVAALDAVSAGIASKVLLPAKALATRPLTREAANVAVQLPTQGTLGATGEVAGSLLAGEEIRPGDVGAEFFGEFIGAPAEVAGMRGAAAARQTEAVTPAVLPDDAPSAPPATIEGTPIEPGAAPSPEAPPASIAPAFDPTLEAAAAPEMRPSIVAKEPVGEPTADTLYGRFQQLLAQGTTADPQAFAQELGVDEAGLQPLIDQGIEDGLLRVNSRGQVRRTAKARRATPAAQPSAAAPIPQEPRLPPQTRPLTLSVPADQVIDRRIAQREQRLARPIATVTADYAVRLEDALSTPEHAEILTALRTDKAMTKADVHDLADALGVPVVKSASKEAALQAIEARHAAAVSDNAETDQFLAAIRAWHASPNDFDAFDPAFQNTGGGSQYKGGFSFSQNPGISGPEGAWTASTKKQFGKAHVYDVLIDADESSIPDFSKTFAQQPPNVQQALLANEDLLRQRWASSARAATFDDQPFDYKNPGHVAALKIAQVKDRAQAIADYEGAATRSDLTPEQKHIAAQVVDILRREAEPQYDLFSSTIPIGSQYGLHKMGFPPEVPELGFKVYRAGRDEVVVTDPSLIKILAKDGRPVSPAERATQLADMQAAMGNRPQPSAKAIRQGIANMVKRGEVVKIPARVIADVHAAAEPLLSMVPGEVTVTAVSRIEPSGIDASVVRLVLQDRDGVEHALLAPWNILEATRAFHLPGRNLIGIVRYLPASRDASGQYVNNVAAELGHEIVHALRGSGRLVGDNWNRLLSHAHGLRLLDGDFATYLTTVGDPYADRAGDRTTREVYAEYYSTREDFQEIMDQEAVAHLMEWHLRGLLIPQEIAPVRDLIEGILAGDVGAAAPDYAQQLEEQLAALGAEVQVFTPEVDDRGFFSPSLEAAKQIPQERGTVQQMRAMLLKAGAKPKELEAVGFDKAFPDAQAKVSRGEIEAFLRENRVQLGEELYGAPISKDQAAMRMFGKSYEALDAEGRQWIDSEEASGKFTSNEPRFGPNTDWVTPGGIPGSYREVVTTLPEAKTPELQRFNDARARGEAASLDDYNASVDQTYTSSHWPGITNPLLHYRVKDFASQDGKARVLDEMQSDWAQRARDHGTHDPARTADLERVASEKHVAAQAINKEMAAFVTANVDDPPMNVDAMSIVSEMARGASEPGRMAKALVDRYHAARNEWMDAQNKATSAKKGVPSAPYISTTSDWVDLGLKQALIDAARDPSVTRFAWAPGKVQADRYGLEKHIGILSYDPKLKVLTAFPSNRGVGFTHNDVSPQGLAEYVGRDVAAKLLEQPVVDTPIGMRHVLEGTDLQMGGEGMKSFYGDFAKEGSYTPGIVGTRLLKLVKALDPEAAKIEPANVRAGREWSIAQEPDGGGWSWYSEDGRVGPIFATEQEAEADFIRNGLDGGLSYPSIRLTPRLREALLGGQPLFAVGGKPQDTQAIQTEAEHLTTDVAAFEQRLWEEGRSAEEIAATLHDRYGFEVSPTDLVLNQVWWRLTQGLGRREPLLEELLTEDRDSLLRQYLIEGDEASLQQATDPQAAPDAPQTLAGGQTPQAFPRAGRNLNAVQRETVGALWSQGHSQVEIARHLSAESGKYVRLTSVSDALASLGILDKGKRVTPKAPRQVVWSAEANALLTSEEASGLSAAHLASRVSELIDQRVTAKAVYRQRAKLRAKGAEITPVSPSAKAAAMTAGKFQWTDDALSVLTSKEIDGLTASQIAQLLNARFGGPTLSSGAVRQQKSRLVTKAFNAAIGGPSDPEAWLTSFKENQDARPRSDEQLRGETDPRGGEAAPGEPGAGAADFPGQADHRYRGRVGQPGRFVVPGGRGRGAVPLTGAVFRGRSVHGLGESWYFAYGKEDPAFPSSKPAPDRQLKIVKGLGNWTTKAHLIERTPGNWELIGIATRHNRRRRGLAARTWDAIEADLGVKLTPPGRLTRDLYRFLEKRNPALVASYQRLSNGLYYSPKQLVRLLTIHQEIANQPTEEASPQLKREIAQAQKGVAEISAVLDSLPAGTELFDKAAFALGNKPPRTEASSGLSDPWSVMQNPGSRTVPAGDNLRLREIARGLVQIERDGQKIGHALATVRGGWARIDNIVVDDGPNSLGVSGIRDLREGFRQLYPNVTEFHGRRNSGARNGSAAAAKNDKMQKVTLFSNPKEGAPAGILASGLPSHSVEAGSAPIDTAPSHLGPFVPAPKSQSSHPAQTGRDVALRPQALEGQHVDFERIRDQGLDRDITTVGPHKVEVNYTDVMLGKGNYEMEFTIDGSPDTKHVNPDHYWQIFNAVRQSVFDYIAEKNPTALAFDVAGGDKQKTKIFTTFAQAYADRVGGEFGKRDGWNWLQLRPVGEALPPPNKQLNQPSPARLPSQRVDAGSESDFLAAIGSRPPLKMGSATATGLDAPAQSLTDLVGEVTDALGLTSRIGRLSPGLKMQAAQQGGTLMGQFGTVTGVVRTKLPNDLQTLAHEGGHALEVRPSLRADLDALKRAHANELTASIPDLSEGFAEFFRTYVTNPVQAQQDSPQFFADFEDLLDAKEPAMLEALENVQAGVMALANASPVGIIRSRIQSTVKPGRLARLRKALVEDGLRNTFADKFYGFYHASFDSKHPFKVGVQYLLGIAEANLGRPLARNEKLVLKAINDPYKLARLSEHAKVHATATLQNGVVPKGHDLPSGPSFWMALEAAFGGKARGQWNEEMAQRFGTYLVSRRMLAEFERFNRGELPNPPDQLILPDVWSKAYVELERAHPNFAQAADLLYQFNQNLLQLKLDNGFLTPELYAELSQRTDYVPLNRIMDDAAPSTLIRAKGQNKANMIRQFKGSQRDFINPLESITQDVYATMARVALNDTIRAMDRLARAAGPGGGRIAERIPATEMKGTRADVREALRVAARDAGLDAEQRQALFDTFDDLFDQNVAANIFRATETNERGEPIVYLWEGGVKVPIRLGDDRIGRDIFQVFQALGQDNSDTIIDTLALGAQALRFGVTKSLDYFTANILRDQIATWMLSTDFTPFVTAAKGAKGLLPGSELGQRYAAFGGLMGGIDTALTDEIGQHDVLSLRRKGFFGTPAKGRIGTVYQTTMRTLESSEALTRFGHFESAYQRALADGFSPEESAIEAAYAAHDVMDFSRRGAKVGVYARITAFLNAALQGLDAARRTMSGERDTYKSYRELATPYLKAATGQGPLSIAEKQAIPNAVRIWVKMASVGLIAGVGLAALYRDDDEAEEHNDYMRATHWFFKLGGTWVRWPKPFELAGLSNLFEATFDLVWKKDERAFEKFRASLFHTMIPPSDPNLVRFIYEQVTGYDMFRGQEIVPQHLQKLPPEMQFNAYTSELGREIGKVTGLSPARIDHVISGLFGTVGRQALTLSDYAIPRLTGREPRAEKSLEDMWFLSRFTRRAGRGSLSTQAFWEQMTQSGGTYVQAAEGYKHELRLGNRRSARDLIEDLDPEPKAYAVLEGHFKEEDQDLHPLNRARQVLSISSVIRRDMVLGRLFKEKSVKAGAYRDKDFAPERIVLSPAKQKIVNETMEDLSMREARNALIVIGHPGWQNKNLMPTDGLVAELAAVSPEIAAEFAYRQANGKNKVYSFEAVQELWPQAKERLLKDGEDARLTDLKVKAKALSRFKHPAMGGIRLFPEGQPEGELFAPQTPPPGMMRLGGPLPRGAPEFTSKDEWGPPETQGLYPGEAPIDDSMVIPAPEPDIDPKMRSIDARKMAPSQQYLTDPKDNVDTLRRLEADI